MNLIGADIVEVAPAYDHAEITGVAGSHVAFELVTLLADNAVEGERFGAETGYAAQSLDRRPRRAAGFSTAPLGAPVVDQAGASEGAEINRAAQ
jgi:agmatinase